MKVHFTGKKRPGAGRAGQHLLNKQLVTLDCNRLRQKHVHCRQPVTYRGQKAVAIAVAIGLGPQQIGPKKGNLPQKRQQHFGFM